MDNAGLDEELFEIVSAVVSIQKLITVWYVEFSTERTASLKCESYFQKRPLSGPRKRYKLSFCIAVHPSWLLVGAEFGWKICEV